MIHKSKYTKTIKN